MGCLEIEATDHVEGIAPVPPRVGLDPGRPGKIIAVSFAPAARELVMVSLATGLGDPGPPAGVRRACRAAAMKQAPR